LFELFLTKVEPKPSTDDQGDFVADRSGKIKERGLHYVEGAHEFHLARFSFSSICRLICSAVSRSRLSPALSSR
jgi:hypothetical protein